VLAAARDLLADRGFSTFTLEAVAQRAGVTRQTVHNQFGNKIGLLEALCDAAALEGGLADLAAAFQQRDAWTALDAFIGVFVRFWASDQGLTRRLHGLAALDPEFGEVIRARQERRLGGIRVLLGRLCAHNSSLDAATAEAAISTLFMLTSYECYDALVSTGQDPDRVTLILRNLARAALKMGI
jgi:AcrR family transcriptional regulator